MCLPDLDEDHMRAQLELDLKARRRNEIQAR